MCICVSIETYLHEVEIQNTEIYLTNFSLVQNKYKEYSFIVKLFVIKKSIIGFKRGLQYTDPFRFKVRSKNSNLSRMQTADISTKLCDKFENGQNSETATF